MAQDAFEVNLLGGAINRAIGVDVADHTRIIVAAFVTFFTFAAEIEPIEIRDHKVVAVVGSDQIRGFSCRILRVAPFRILLDLVFGSAAALDFGVEESTLIGRSGGQTFFAFRYFDADVRVWSACLAIDDVDHELAVPGTLLDHRQVSHHQYRVSAQITVDRFD